MTFVGIDPSGLAHLGRLLERHSATIAEATDRAMEPLLRAGRESVADRVATRLTGTVRFLRTIADDFQWRIERVLAVDRGYWPRLARPPTRAEMALGMPIGMGPPLGPVSVTFNDIMRLSRMTPREVSDYFAAQPAEVVGILTAAYPDAINRLDGAPPRARYAASDILIGRRIASLRDQVVRHRAELDRGGLSWLENRILGAMADDAAAEITELERWLAEDRQILLFDSSGDGRVIEVFGDLESARDIGVVVPGITNDRGNFSEGDGGFRANARNIHERAGQLGIDDVAVVAWLGYDTPDGADAILRTAAIEGHGALVDFVAGLDALATSRHIAVIGHSYGSLVTGLAAGVGLDANEVVFVGSPGTGLDHADDAKLKPGGVVWAGLASGDPIGAGLDITEYLTPQQQLEQAVRRIFDLFDGESDLRDLHHGINPAHDDFGAIEIHTDGSTGHSAYFEPGTTTLDNLLYIIAGMDGEVSIENPDVAEMAPGPFGGEQSPSL